MSRTDRTRNRSTKPCATDPRRDPASTVPAWALLSSALSYENRVQAWRPDVDSAVQLAVEIALSDRGKFRYNRG